MRQGEIGGTPRIHSLLFLLSLWLCAEFSVAQTTRQAAGSGIATERRTANRVSRWDQVPRVPFVYAENINPIEASEQARVVDAAMVWAPAGRKVWFAVMTCDHSAEVYFVPDTPDGRLRKGKFAIVTWNENHWGYDVPGDLKDYWDVAPPGKAFAGWLAVPAGFNFSLPFCAPELPERDVVQMVDAIRRAVAEPKSLIGMSCGHERIGGFLRRGASVEVECQSWEYSGSIIRLYRRGNDYRCELSGLWVSP